MKKILITLVILASITACGGDKSQLNRNAMKYIQAMAEYRIDDARHYATTETCKYTLDYIQQKIMPKLDSSYIEQNTPAKIHIDSIVLGSDTQAVVYFHKRTPIQPRVDATVEMRLRDGQWLAHQVIKPAPLIGGSFRAIDTTALNRDSLQNNHDGFKLPERIVRIGE